jgi:acetylornithine/succinyldiaminopimelate/putrescine aminotransferase
VTVDDALLGTGRPRLPLSLVRGEGARVYDARDRPYLDFSSATGSAPLGHAHPRWRAAVHAHVDALSSADAAVGTPARARVAELLASIAPMADARVLLCGSGGDALSVAIGLAVAAAGGDRTTVVALEGSRTAALADASAAAWREATGRIVPVPRGDVPAMQAAVDGAVAAVVVDALAIRTGVRPLGADGVRAVAGIARERGCVLVADELDGGMGRSGDWLAISAAGVVPDVAALGDGLGGGVALGAVLATADVAAEAGDRAARTTASPIACAAGAAVLEAISDEQLLDNAAVQGERLRAELAALAARSALVREVHGRGVLVGISLSRAAAHEFVLALLAEGVLATDVAPTEVLLAPPLVVEPDDIDAAVGAVATVLDSLDVGARV